MLEQAKKILNALMEAGFDDARVTITETDTNELSIAHNHVSMMRTMQSQSLAIMAIQELRRVTATITGLDDSDVAKVIAELKRDVATSPQDEAYAVAPNQKGNFVKGPQLVDRESIAASAKGLLEHRSAHYPTFQIEECAIKHVLEQITLVTSRDTELMSSIGCYEVSLMGASKDEHGSSSFNYTGGSLEALPLQLAEVLDIDVLMANSVCETQTEMIGEKFTGDVVLTPMAVMDLLGWLSGQISDIALISQTSLYRDSVGDGIAADLLSIRNYPEAPGESPFNSEGFIVLPTEFIESGQLLRLLPSFYGSRKLKLPHIASGEGTRIAAGEVSRANMIKNVNRGALVGRLSMGSPAPNGDFSGVIKNSFLVESGQRGTALSETMITGNVAQMLKDITEISAEVSDLGNLQLPWLRIKGLRFS